MSADDTSLLAMHAAGMALRSIAQTMGWTVARTERRLNTLNGVVEPGVQAAAGSSVAADPEPAREQPIGDGEGLILRTFTVQPAGYGADCVLADGRRVFTLTGRERQELGDKIKVAQSDGVWVMAGVSADA